MNLSETRVRIYNLALTKLGITERLTAYTDDDPAAKTFTAVWEQVLHEVLELVDWKCARRRAVLQRDKDAVEGASKTKPVVVTATAHKFEDGDIVRFTDVGGMTQLNGNKYMVKNPAANTFELYTEDGTAQVDGTGYGTWTSGGIIWRIPNFGFSYCFRLPDDCIRVIESEVDAGSWAEEHNIFLTDYEDDELEILYIRYLTDPTYFSPLLADAVATRLGAVCAPALKASGEKQAKLDSEFSALITLARGQDIRSRQEPEKGSKLITEV